MYLKHLSCSLTIACCDERSVHINEPTRLEERVGGVSQGIPDARNRPYEIGPGPQVEPLSQALHALALLAERILPFPVVAFAQPQNLVSFQLNFLQENATCLMSVYLTWTQLLGLGFEGTALV